MTAETNGGKTAEYGYDMLNRQIYVHTADGREQKNCYDGEGLRAGLTENGRDAVFVFYGGEILTECDAEQEPTRRHLKGNRLTYVQTMEDDAFHAYHQDEQGSTAYITNGNGQIENIYQYDAFGNVLASRENIRNRMLYTCQQYDRETCQYYLRARYYNPAVGRFMQEDTCHGDGLNLYAYCGNNPVVYHDPSGNTMEYSDDINNNLGQTKSGDTIIPDLSNKAVKHPMNDHMPIKYAKQLQYMSKDAAEEYLSYKTFFNSNWTDAQVRDALNIGYKEALNSGITTGKYSFTYLGENVTVYLEDSVFRTGYGDYVYTYDELLKLLGGE